MDQFGVPCRHMIAFLVFKKDLDAVFTRFAACYKVSSFCNAFHGRLVEVPLVDELATSAMRPAPICVRLGKSKKKRIRSNGEDVPTKVYRCKNCHQIGHNRRTCTNPSAGADSD